MVNFLFEQKINHINRFIFENLHSNECKMHETPGYRHYHIYTYIYVLSLILSTI